MTETEAAATVKGAGVQVDGRVRDAVVKAARELGPGGAARLLGVHASVIPRVLAGLGVRRGTAALLDASVDRLAAA